MKLPLTLPAAFVFISCSLFANALGWQNLPTVSLFQPIGSDSIFSHQLILSKEKIKADVFPGYAVFEMELLFINPSEKNIEFQVGFPKCENENCPKLYWLRMNLSNTLPLAPTEIISGGNLKYLSWKILRR